MSGERGEQVSAEVASDRDPIVRVVVSGFEPEYCGILQGRLSPDSGFATFFRTGSSDEVLSDCLKMYPCVWLASEAVIGQLDPHELGSTIGYGRLVQVLVVGAKDDEDLPRRVLQMGCSGFLPTDAPPETVSKAIQAVARGELWADRRLSCQVLQESLQQSSNPSLTPREREILWLITEGKTNRAIAEMLHITRDTVRWHIRGLYTKIGVKDRLSAVFFAREFFATERTIPEDASGTEKGQLRPVSPGGLDPVERPGRGT